VQNSNRTWAIYRKSKKDPVRIEAASLTNVDGQYVFIDSSGAEVGRFDISAVEGYSVERA
jgi:hypothetical protein